MAFRAQHLQFHIERSFQRGRGCGIFWALIDAEGNIKSTAANVVFEAYVAETRLSDFRAPLELREDEVQGLIDELWRNGYRPNADVSGEGLVAAQREHIKDLRDLLSRLSTLKP